jgi:hypothetical protein
VQPRQPSSPRSSRPQQQAVARSTPRPAAQLAQLPTPRPSWPSDPSRRQPALLRPRAVADPRVPLVIPVSASFPRRTRPRRAPPPSPTRTRVGSHGLHVEDRLPPGYSSRVHPRDLPVAAAIASTESRRNPNPSLPPPPSIPRLCRRFVAVKQPRSRARR